MAMRSNDHELLDGTRAVIDDEARVVILSKPDWSLQLAADTGIKPLWLSHAPKAILGAFGADLPYDNVAAVAAFPLSVLRADLLVVAYRQFGGDTALWVSTMFADDVAALAK
jgi:hypothetical protein